MQTGRPAVETAAVGRPKPAFAGSRPDGLYVKSCFVGAIAFLQVARTLPVQNNLTNRRASGCMVISTNGKQYAIISARLPEYQSCAPPSGCTRP